MLYGPREVYGENLLTFYGTFQGLQVLSLDPFLAPQDLSAYVFNELPVDNFVVLGLHPADYLVEDPLAFGIHLLF